MTLGNRKAWLAFDIGGANLKVAHSEGEVVSRPFELWKRPEDLSASLSELAATLPSADAWAITTTAELCDCFATKADGVRSILKACTGAAGGRAIRVWGTDGRFHSVGSILERPKLAAASNWLALATVVARSGADSGLLIDVGSTTTDLIPWKSAAVTIPLDRRTDLDRLQAATLVYSGVRRTPLCALSATLPYRGRETALMAELFATTLDVYLTLGEVAPDPFDHSTGDGGPSTIAAARTRLARMVGLDSDDFTAEDAAAMAQAADSALRGRLASAAHRVSIDALGAHPSTVVVAGSGEFLARRIAERVVNPGGSLISLNQTWGAEASTAACARALLDLVGSEDGVE